MATMSPIVKISLILIATIVVGAVIRMTVFQRYMPEGFENDKKEEEDKTKEGDKDKEGEKGNEGGEAVKLDSDANMRNFLQENGDNKKLMGSINSDTHAMIQNQKELMDMMKTVQPALRQGMEFMKAFKGMMKQE
jgi:hypothetical protein